MSVVFVAGVWLVLGVVVCFLSSGRGGRRQVPTRLLVTEPAPETPTGRRFVARPAHLWTAQADRAALVELLSRPAESLDLASPQA